MPRYSTIVSTLISRLQAHNVALGILAGFKFVTIPVADPEGERDLASGVLRMFLPEIKEKAHDQLAIISGGTFTMKLTVSTKKDSGIAAHVLACEKVMDAIELNGSTIDLLLGATLAKPLEISVGEPFIPDGGISINSHVTVTVVPKAFKSGARRS